jgi:hypothetical protein
MKGKHKKSNKKKTNEKVSITKQNKTPFWVWALALVPAVSAAVFFAIAAGLIPSVALDVFYETEAGDIAWHTSSILVLLVTMAVWAACGFVYGYFRAKMPVAVLTFHALPIVCTLVYTVCVTVLLFGGDFNLGIEVLGAPLTAENLALLSAMGMGLFSYIDSFIYAIVYTGNFGLYLDLMFMALIFLVGFAIGKSRRLKA